MPSNRSVPIDLDQVVKTKFGDKKIPRFVVNWIKRFIHQDYINEYIRQGHVGVDFAREALVYFDAPVTVEGLENLPEDGRFTFAGNHPLGGIDALGIIAAVGERYKGNIAFLAKGARKLASGL